MTVFFKHAAVFYYTGPKFRALKKATYLKYFKYLANFGIRLVSNEYILKNNIFKKEKVIFIKKHHFSEENVA